MKIKNLHIKEYNGLENLDINFESEGKVLDLMFWLGLMGVGKLEFWKVFVIGLKCLEVKLLMWNYFMKRMK